MTGAFWLLQSILCKSGQDDADVVFACGIIVGLAVFDDDWDTQRTKARDFLGGG